MSHRGMGLALLAVTVLAASPILANEATLFPAEAAIPNSRVIRFTSAIDKEPYAIQVAIPFSPPPKAGYPVIYVLDGELYFSEAAIAANLLAENTPIVVGVGHGAMNDKAVIARYAKADGSKPDKALDGAMAFDAVSNLRNYDFKWPVSPAHRAPPLAEKTIGRETGDVDAFLQVIEKEIKPRVEKLAPIDRGHQALFGHSAGGLAVVHALFTEPGAFASFIAASPSIWYDGASVLNGEKSFGAMVTAGKIAPRVLITSGALEPDNMTPPKSYMDKLTPAERAQVLPWATMRGTWPGMLTGARTLAARLKALHGKTGYKVDYQLIADQDHQSSAFVAVIRAMPFAFGK